MNLIVLNMAILAAWLMVSAGAWMLRPWAGLVVGGLFLALLTLIMAQMFGVHTGKRRG